jgi:Zn-dependent peptidase ImmA (M78 family)/DNA-binding XRE family transcriptional regulator
MFNADRLRLARQRRNLSGKALAEKAGITAVTISKIENGHQPEDYVVSKISDALSYPKSFFYRESADILDADTVSFRSLKKMSATERDASLAAGSLGVSLYGWIDGKFNLPRPDLIDLSKERDHPETAARLLRQHWGLGEKPIGHVLKLLESKGVRILSLSEDTQNVDAYSFWRNGSPYIFLNQEKSAERSIFDSAHELAHLVLHHHAGAKTDRHAETQADQFASAFLMPSGDVKNAAAHVFTVRQVISLKRRWKVSAMALAYRMHRLGMLSEWSYRTMCIDLGQLGYRSAEPEGITRETSTVLAKVLSAMWTRKLTKDDISKDLGIPLDEIETLIFRLTAGPTVSVPNLGQLSVVGGN